MKKIHTLWAMMALLLAAGMLSCTKEPTPEPGNGKPDIPDTPAGQYISFVAGTPEAESEGASAATSASASLSSATTPDTRAGWDDVSGHAVWEAGDLLGVFVQGSYTNSNLCFTQKSGTLSDDGRTVEYEGTLASSVTGTKSVYAVYPYDLKATISGTKITTTFPGRQSYSPDGYTGIPLFGKYEGDIANLNFKTFMNPFAVVELRLCSQEAVKVTRIVFQGNNNETVSGSIKVEMSGARPAVTFATSGTLKSITLDCGTGVELTTTPKSFYIAIPVQEYARGYRFDVRTDREGANGVVLQAKSGGVTPVANTICVTPERTLAAADFQQIIPDAAFRAFLAHGGWITVDDATTGAVTVINTTGTSMSCSSWNISSLEGIEYFPQLTSLNCSLNQLAALDVKANTLLETLQCYANQLISLTLGINTNLTSLSCYSNRLTALDVKANTGLTHLTCNDNQLTALDVTANTNLTSLSCYSNQLTTLDVKANTNLTTLKCSNNQLTSVTLGDNTNLTTLACYSNQLTALDVKANTNLTSLTCYDNRLTTLDLKANRNLTTLECNTNRLTALDVTANTNLTTLNCSINRLTSLDVKANTGLTTLYCSSNRLTELDVKANTGLTTLYCSSNRLTALDVKANTGLTTLNCSSNQLTELDVKANTGLTELNCSYNRLTALDATAMAAPTSYTLYCGGQETAAGETITLQLTLKVVQQGHWEQTLQSKGYNASVDVNYEP